MSNQLIEGPLFEDTPRRERKLAKSLGTRMEVDEGYTLVLEGHLAREFAIIISGVATVTVAGAPVATLGPGQCYGAVALLDHAVNGALSAATVITASPTLIEVLSVPEFRTMLAVAPTVKARLERLVAARRSEIEAARQDARDKAFDLEHALTV